VLYPGVGKPVFGTDATLGVVAATGWSRNLSAVAGGAVSILSGLTVVLGSFSVLTLASTAVVSVLGGVTIIVPYTSSLGFAISFGSSMGSGMIEEGTIG